MLSLWFWRWAHIYSSSLLLSLFAFQRLYVIPVLDRERCRSNLADESCLDSLKWICWLVMLISGINWLLVIVASITNTGIQLATLEEVIGLTQFGHLWLFRSLIGLAIAGGLVARQPNKTLVRAFGLARHWTRGRQSWVFGM